LEADISLFSENSPLINEVQKILSISPGMILKDILLVLKLATPEALWKALLDLQFDMARLKEMSFLNRYCDYNKKIQVLEIGFGIDHVIGGIRPYFPQAEIKEVVLNFSYLFAGKNNYKNVTAEIEKQIGSCSQQYDNIHLRLVAQHVNQFGAMIKSIGNYLKDDGNIVIMEAYDSYLKWSPNIPSLTEMFAVLGQLQKAKGGLRTSAEKIHRKASIYGFTPLCSEKMEVASQTQTDLRNYYQFFLLVSEIINRMIGSKINQLKLIKEMLEWLGDPTAFGQFGLQFVKLKKCD